MDTKPGSESPTQTRRAPRRTASGAPGRNAGSAASEVENKPNTDDGPHASTVVHAPEQLAPSIEALLLSVDRPLTPARLAEALGLVAEAEDDQASESGQALLEDARPRPKRSSRKGGTDSPVQAIAAAVALLNQQYEATGRSFRIEKLAGGYRVMTLPKFAAVLAAYHGRRERQALSKAAIETLSIVAYKQPLTRATLEAIRGVACGEVLRSLTERRLITIVGRAEEVGRPILYGTTKQFLELFGLSGVKDLPSVDEFKLRGVASEDD